MLILVSSPLGERRRVFSGPLASLQVSAAARTLGGARTSEFKLRLLSAGRAWRAAAARGQQSAGPGRGAWVQGAERGAGRRHLRSGSERGSLLGG